MPRSKPPKVKRLIPYAGYDVTEARHLPSGGRLTAGRILELQAQGMSIKEIAVFLAIEHNRQVAYTIDGIHSALHRGRQ